MILSYCKLYTSKDFIRRSFLQQFNSSSIAQMMMEMNICFFTHCHQDFYFNLEEKICIHLYIYNSSNSSNINYILDKIERFGEMNAEQFFTNNNLYTCNVLLSNYNDNMKLINSRCCYMDLREQVYHWLIGVM